jgi:hypothetical protein
LGVLGSIPYDFEYYFFVETSSFKTPEKMPHLLDAFVSYTRMAPYASVSVGQFKSPISQEQNTSCSGLYTIDRSQVVAQLAGPQRDMGIMVYGGNDTTLLKYSLAYMNGSGMNVGDDTKGKDIVGRITAKPIEMFRVGGSFRLGKTLPTDITQKENDIYRFAGEFAFTHKNIRIEGEYMHGIDKLHSAAKVPIYGGCGGIVGYETKQEGEYAKNGFYAMAMYRTKWNIEPIIKYDTWDPDLDIDTDWQNTITFGFSYYANDWTRIQMNYVNVQEDSEIVNDRIMIQIQAKF